MEHTKTPWTADKHPDAGYYQIHGQPGTNYIVALASKQADARRICAAVNAVEGIGTEWLENNAARLHTIVNELAEKRAEVDRLQAQNTKMLEALKEIVSPISYMQERLQEGERLNGREAINMAHSVEYLREIARAAIAEAETKIVVPQQDGSVTEYDNMKEAFEKEFARHITAADLQAFSTKLDYTRQIGHLQNAIRQFVSTSQFAMRLLSQNEGDALAQSCITQLAQAINAVATFGTGPMIQERPRPEEPEMPDYDTND